MAGNGHLASDAVVELLRKLSCTEVILLHQGMVGEEVELLKVNAITRLFRKWVHEQKANFETVLSRALAQETWAPLTSYQRVSSSIVDLFQCFAQTVQLFLGVVQPSTSKIMHMHLDKMLQEIVGAVFTYTTHVKALCGTVEEV